MAVSDGFWACRECIVVGQSAHCVRSSPEAFARLIDRLALCVGRSKRGASAGAPNETHAPLNRSKAENDRGLLATL